MNPKTTRIAPATISQCGYSIGEKASVISPSPSANLYAPRETRRSLGQALTTLGSFFGRCRRIYDFSIVMVANSFARAAFEEDGCLADILTVSPSSTSRRMASERPG